MFRHLPCVLVIAAAACACAMTPSAQAAGDYRVIARSANHDVGGKAVYRERLIGTTLEQRFNVSVEGQAPNSDVEIRFNGALVATIRTNALGRGQVEFAVRTVDDNPNDGHPPLPQDFPHIVVGDTIQIGAATATFRRG